MKRFFSLILCLAMLCTLMGALSIGVSANPATVQEKSIIINNRTFETVDNEFPAQSDGNDSTGWFTLSYDKTTDTWNLILDNMTFSKNYAGVGNNYYYIYTESANLNITVKGTVTFEAFKNNENNINYTYKQEVTITGEDGKTCQKEVTFFNYFQCINAKNLSIKGEGDAKLLFSPKLKDGESFDNFNAQLVKANGAGENSIGLTIEGVEIEARGAIFGENVAIKDCNIKLSPAYPDSLSSSYNMTIENSVLDLFAQKTCINYSNSSTGDSPNYVQNKTLAVNNSTLILKQQVKNDATSPLIDIKIKDITVVDNYGNTYHFSRNARFYLDGIDVSEKYYGELDELTIKSERKQFNSIAFILADLYARGYFQPKYITLTASEGGTITGDAKVQFRADAEYAITANEGYTLAKLLLDGEEIELSDTLTLKRIVENHTIEAIFSPVEEPAD